MVLMLVVIKMLIMTALSFLFAQTDVVFYTYFQESAVVL